MYSKVIVHLEFLNLVLKERKIPIVLFCNKQDLEEDALSEKEIREIINVQKMAGGELKFDWRNGSAVKKTGIEDSISWLYKNIHTQEEE